MRVQLLPSSSRSSPLLSMNHDVDRMQITFVSIVTISGTIFLAVLYFLLPSKSNHKYLHDDHYHLNESPFIPDPVHGARTGVSHLGEEPVKCPKVESVKYNSKYPLTEPEVISPVETRFKIALITDLDTKSKREGKENVWSSFMLKGYLTQIRPLDSILTQIRPLNSILTQINPLNSILTQVNPSKSIVSSLKSPNGSPVNDYKYAISWERRSVELSSSLSFKGRGMELSDLVVFNGSLLACDDRTGVVYEILLPSNDVVPRHIISDGDGSTSMKSAFKCEWMTVKDEKLYIGGFGKEWTNSSGAVINFNPQFVKVIDVHGSVSHVNWRSQFLSLLSSVGIHFPGYIIHESCSWSSLHQRWFFLPRRVSTTPYRESEDELKGSNLLISAGDLFNDVKVTTIGPSIPSHGFSSFKFIPNTNDQHVIALKTVEVKDDTSTFITIFTLEGHILLPEIKVGTGLSDTNAASRKYEGIEFI